MKIFRLTSIILMITILLSSCMNSNQPVATNETVNSKESSTDSASKNYIDDTQSDPSKSKIILEEQYIKHSFQINKIYEGKKVYRRFYNSDHTHYFNEEYEMTHLDEMGDHLLYSIYYEDHNKNLLGSGEFINLEKALSPTPILWLNNHQAFIPSGNIEAKYYLYDTITQKKTDIGYPEKSSEYGFFNSDWNPQTQMIAIVYSDDNGMKLYGYNVQNHQWKELFKYPFGDNPLSGMNHNVAYGLNGDLFFDSPDEQYNIIRKYNLNTGKISIFKNNAKLLNASPDDRFISYIDKEKKTTKIYDQKTKQTLEIPLSTELTWNDHFHLFLSVENNRTLLVNNIKNGLLTTRKIDLDKNVKMGKDTYVVNTTFSNGKILFDKVTGKYINETDSIYYDLNKDVKTYEITFQ